jgi:hypothetical protein
MALNLLCACVGFMDGTNDLDTMNCTRCIGCLILLWSDPPELGLPLSCSYAFYCSLLCVSALTVSQRCRDRGGSPNEARHGSPTDRVWPSAPRPHLPTTPPPRRPPRPPPWRSQATVPTTSHPSRRLLLAGWSGLISRGLLWDLTQAPSEIWPPLRSQSQWLHQIRRPARLPSRPMPYYTALTLRVMAMKPAKAHNNGLTLACRLLRLCI